MWPFNNNNNNNIPKPISPEEYERLAKIREAKAQDEWNKRVNKEFAVLSKKIDKAMKKGYNAILIETCGYCDDTLAKVSDWLTNAGYNSFITEKYIAEEWIGYANQMRLSDYRRIRWTPKERIKWVPKE